MEVREEQLQKAKLPILVTPSGITMEVREEQLQKAKLPILVTLVSSTLFWIFDLLTINLSNAINVTFNVYTNPQMGNVVIQFLII